MTPAPLRPARSRAALSALVACALGGGLLLGASGCQPSTGGRVRGQHVRDYRDALDARYAREGTAFDADTLARLGMLYRFTVPDGPPADTARGRTLLREAARRGSGDGYFGLALDIPRPEGRGALLREAARRGNRQAAEWLVAHYADSRRPMHLDSLVLALREATAAGVPEADTLLRANLSALARAAEAGDSVAVRWRDSLKAGGLWDLTPPAVP